MNEIVKAIRETPQRIKDALSDPVRRRHSASRITESYVPSFLMLLLVTGSVWKAAVLAGVVTLGEFLLFEWVLEPLGWGGYYWERGPRDGETFTKP